jgi:hypothetical protein
MVERQGAWSASGWLTRVGGRAEPAPAPAAALRQHPEVHVLALLAVLAYDLPRHAGSKSGGPAAQLDLNGSLNGSRKTQTIMLCGVGMPSCATAAVPPICASVHGPCSFGIRPRPLRQNPSPRVNLGYTKGVLFQIDTADRFSRETLEKRLEKTPSNARCFAQGSSLMC